MTFAPATLNALAAYWKQQGGVNLGIVGDEAHQRRQSYHNGQDVIAAHGRTAANDYTIRHARDREPFLTNAAAGIDLGKLDGTLAELRRFSNWLVAACLTDATSRRDVREILYSPDGKTVQRYDGPTNAVRVEGDDSHLWHTHISYYRDSEKRDKVAVFAPFFLPDTDTEEDMGPTFENTGPLIGIATTKQAIGIIPTEGGPYVSVPVGYRRNVSGIVTVTGPKYAGQKAYLVAVPDGAPGSTGLLLASAASFVPSTDNADFNAGVMAASQKALEAKR